MKTNNNWNVSIILYMLTKILQFICHHLKKDGYILIPIINFIKINKHNISKYIVILLKKIYLVYHYFCKR